MNLSAPEKALLLESVFTHGDGAAGFDDKHRVLTQLRCDPDTAAWVDRVFLERLAGAQQSLLKVKEVQRKLEGVLEKLASPPWFPATYVGPVPTAQGPRACVQTGNTRRIVALAQEVPPDSLAVGDDVYLGKEWNVVLGKSPEGLSAGGETCSFERRLPDGRLVVRSRDEQLIVTPRAALRAAELKPGDLLRWDRDALLAREQIERGQTSHHLVEETPNVSFDDIGGLGPQITKIQRALLLDMKYAGVARQMHRKPKGGILLYGPTGTGKTMIAKALANWLAQKLGAQRSFFMNIKPSALHSMWFSKSEENYRELFRVARELAAAHPDVPIVMFWDEIDYLAARSQHTTSQAQNSVLTAFIAELDGFTARGNIVLVGATNRPDALDPALLRPGRLGDLKLEVPRPNLKAARDIFARHLVSDIAYARNGHGDDLEATRQEIIDAAVSRIFAPNGAGELATLVFRDGSRRPVHMADLINGAMIANIASEAIDRACYRHIDTGAPVGLALDDVDTAIVREFDSAAGTLTPTNCRQHLTGLPHDLDVVNVQRPQKKVSRSGRFLHAV